MKPCQSIDIHWSSWSFRPHDPFQWGLVLGRRRGWGLVEAGKAQPIRCIHVHVWEHSSSFHVHIYIYTHNYTSKSYNMFLFIIYTYIVYYIILYTCICAYVNIYIYIYTTIIVLFAPTIWNVDPFEANVGQLRDRKKSNRRGRPLFPCGGYLVGRSLDWLKGKTPGIIQETSEKQGFYHIINCSGFPVSTLTTPMQLVSCFEMRKVNDFLPSTQCIVTFGISLRVEYGFAGWSTFSGTSWMDRVC